MQNRLIKYSGITLLILVVGYNSINIKSLSRVLAEKTKTMFNAKDYAQQYWKNSLMPAIPKTIELNSLIIKLKSNPNNAFEEYAHALGIGNIKYFLVKGIGSVIAIDENRVIIKSSGEKSGSQIQLETEFVYGNAVRDAVGSISLNEFKSTADLNQVSQELNKIIRTEIVPPFIAKVKVGDIVQYGGAVELNQKYFTLDKVEVIPVLLSIQ